MPSDLRAETETTLLEGKNLFNRSAEVFCGISLLLSTIMCFIEETLLPSSVSSSVRSSPASITQTRRSASAIDLIDWFTPMHSTSSSVSRMPAVSMILIGIPLWIKVSSILSLVVPGTGVTIALSSFKSALSKDDLPTLGRPIMAVLMPSRRISPERQSSSMAPPSLIRSSRRFSHSSLAM